MRIPFTPPSVESQRSILLEVVPLAAISLALCWKLIYFSALLPGEWWVSMNDWWRTDQDPITGWLRTPGQILAALQARPLMLSATLACLALVGWPLFLVPRFWRLPVLLVVDVLLTLLGIAGFLHYRFFGDVLSVTDLYVVHQLPVVVPSITRQLHPLDAVHFLDVILGVVLAPAYAVLGRKTGGLEIQQRLRLGLAWLLLGLLLGLPASRLAWRDDDGIFTPTSLRYEVAASIGLFPYHLLDVVLTLVDRHHPGTQEEVQKVEAVLAERRREVREPSGLFGIARGLNVILISAESLQAFPIGLQVDGQPVAPRLAEFARESLYFLDFHDQTHLGTTSDAEFMALNSLHPLPARALANKFLENHWAGLPWILRDQGYATMSAVSSGAGIWHMNELHPRYGFERSYFRESFELHEYFGEWASDREFFPQTIPLMRAQPEPFFAFLLSSANHHPYPVPPHHRSLRLGPLEGTLLGDYLQSVHVFDQAFGEFIDGLREAGILDSSVFVLYGDHQGFLGDPPELARLLGFPEDSEFHYLMTRKHVPFLIRLPGGRAAGERHVAGGHLDIAPTILGLLGIDQGAFMLGRDLNRPAPSLVVFRDGSFTDGVHFLVDRFGPDEASTCYEIGTGRRIDCGPLAAERRVARSRLEVSDTIIQDNLIPTLLADRDVIVGSARADP